MAKIVGISGRNVEMGSLIVESGLVVYRTPGDSINTVGFESQEEQKDLQLLIDTLASAFVTYKVIPDQVLSVLFLEEIEAANKIVTPLTLGRRIKLSHLDTTALSVLNTRSLKPSDSNE